MARLKPYIGMALVAAMAAFSLSSYAGDETKEGDAPAEKKAKKKDNKIGKPSKESRQADRAMGDGQWDRGFQMISEHEKDLNITDEQKTRLADLRKSIGEKFSKLREDPDMKELFKQMYEARQGDDKEHTQELRRKIRDAMEKKGVDVDGAMAEIGKILNREQLGKLAELRKKNGMDPNPRKTMREEKAEEKKDAERERPDANKGAPSLYDNETK